MIKESDLKVYLLLGLPIPFQESVIYQPKIVDLLEIGFDKFLQLCLPFACTMDLYTKQYPLLKEIEGLKLFDILFYRGFSLQEDKTNIEAVKELLSILFKTTDIVIKDNTAIVIDNGKVVVDRNNYEELQQIITRVCNIQKLELDDAETQYKNKKNLSVLEKLKRGRAKKAQKYKDNAIFNELNYLIHEMNNMDYEKAQNLTLFQLNNSRIILQNKENWNIRWNIKTAILSQGVDNEEDIEHWSIIEDE